MTTDSLIAQNFWADVARFEKSNAEAVRISANNVGVYHTGRQNRALFLLVKLISHNLSMLCLIDTYKNSPKGQALLDHFSIVSLTRTILDACLMTMYISYPGLSRSAWNLRYSVLRLHDLTNRKRFLSASGQRDAEFMKNYPALKEKIKQEIKLHAQESGTSSEKCEELQKGQVVYVDGARGAARESGWNVNEFEFIQSYFSAFVHSHPVSFMRANEQEISFDDPSEYQIGLCSFAVVIAEKYTLEVVRRMASFSNTDSGDPLGQVDG